MAGQWANYWTSVPLAQGVDLTSLSVLSPLISVGLWLAHVCRVPMCTCVIKFHSPVNLSPVDLIIGPAERTQESRGTLLPPPHLLSTTSQVLVSQTGSSGAVSFSPLSLPPDLLLSFPLKQIWTIYCNDGFGVRCQELKSHLYDWLAVAFWTSAFHVWNE